MPRRLPKLLVALASLLFIFTALPLHAVEFHIGSGLPQDATHFDTLESFRIAREAGQDAQTYKYHLSNGDILTLYQNDSSLTAEIGLSDGASVTVRSNDPDVKRDITILPLNLTRIFNMNHRSSNGSSLTFEGIGTIQGGTSLVSSGVDGGGVVNGWWHNSIYARGVTFRDNKSEDPGTGGGVMYLWDTYNVDLMDANFYNNQTVGRGGAIFINASTTMSGTTTNVTIGATDGHTSTFQGNKHNVGSVNEEYNSIDFTGSTGKIANLFIVTEGDGKLYMMDPFRVNQGNCEVNIIKTGTGTWFLDGHSETNNSGGTTIEIREGTLSLYQGAQLNAVGSGDVFRVLAGAEVEIKGDNRLMGTTVTFEAGSTLTFDMSYFFQNGQRIPVREDDALLFLDGTTLNITGTLVSIEFPIDVDHQTMKGEYTLIEGANALTQGMFQLTVNGEKVTSARFGYFLDDIYKGVQEVNKLVLHVDETQNSVLVWNNADNNRLWDLASRNFYDGYVTKGNDSFIQNDSVVFGGSVGGTITLTQDMYVSKDANRPTGNWQTNERGMRVSDTENWTFNGGSIRDNYDPVDGLMTGTYFLAALVFDGSGTLTLNNDLPNTYHDGTIISGGGRIVAKGVDWLGSTEYVGSTTAGGRVQNSGYGIEFARQTGSTTAGGGQIDFQTGGTLQQRISVGSNSTGTLQIAAGQQMMITADAEYQNYAPTKNGGAVNIGTGGTFQTIGQTIGQFVFLQNTSSGDGGAIWGGTSSRVATTGAAFMANTADGQGGAIYMVGGTNALLDVNGSVFGLMNIVGSGNTAASGGAIYVGDRTTINADHTAFVGNEAVAGDGGAIWGGNYTTINASGTAGATNRTLFTNNTATTSGGAIYAGNSAVITARHADFVDNTATDGDGGAIRTGGNATIDVSGSSGATNVSWFSTNVAGGSGGAIYTLDGSKLTADSTNFTNNTATTSGGAIYAGSSATITAKSVMFDFNTATNGDGGAIRAGNNAKIDVSGTAKVGTASSFSNNVAGSSGGAISVGNAAEKMNLDYTNFGNNTAATRGGAVSVGNNAADITFNGATFANNTVSVPDPNDASQAVYVGEGGAVYAGNFATMTGAGAKFYDNKAGTLGGAIHVGVGADLQIDNSEFLGNALSDADSAGGAIFALSGEIKATHSKFGDATVSTARGNSAGLGGAICVAGGELDVTGSTFDRNTATDWYGGAIVVSDTTLTGTGAAFSNNTAALLGGAIYAGGYGELTLNQSTFVNNSILGFGGGAIFADWGITLLDVSDSRFIGNNTAILGSALETHGGAIFAWDGIQINARNATFGDGSQIGANVADYGGAIAIWAAPGNQSMLNVADATFDGNIAYRDGGALWLVYTDLDTTKPGKTEGTEAWFSNNIAYYGDGGAIYYENADDSTLNIDNAHFDGNIAGGFGGAIYFKNATIVSALNSTFTDNESWAGGAMMLLADGSQLDAAGAEFSGNHADIGGAILMGADSILTVENAVFRENTAGLDGGAICLWGQTGLESTLNVRNALFELNTADGNGSAILVNAATIDGRGAVFQSNTAQSGSGTVYAVDSDANWKDAMFLGNVTGQFGGAMVVEYTDGGSYSLVFGASEGQTSEFSGNLADGKPSSIHFVGTGDTAAGEIADINIRITTDKGSEITENGETFKIKDGEFRMIDAMTVGADNAVAITIVKDGAGTWTLGNSNDLMNTAVGTKVSVIEGRFEMLAGTELLLKNADTTDAFVLKGNSEMFFGGKNNISTTYVRLDGRLSFDLTNIRPNTDSVALTIDGVLSSNDIGSQEINITRVSEQRGLYNLIQAPGATLVDTGRLYYKDVPIDNLDRLKDFWYLNVDVDHSMLQLSIDKSPNITTTWTNATQNFLWNQSDRNWDGMTYTQFLDGDDVIFGDLGAGTVKVDPNDVIVGTMTVDSSNDYTFTGGSVTGTQLDKYGEGWLTLNNKNIFNNVNIRQGTLAGNNGSDYVIGGNLRLFDETSFRPDGAFRVMNDIAFDAGSYIYIDVSKSQGKCDQISASGVMEFAGNGDGTVTIVVGNKDAKSGERISTVPILYAAAGMTLGGEPIADGVYGVANKEIAIASDDNLSQLVFVSDRSLALQKATVGGGASSLSLDAFGTGFGPLGPTTADFSQNQMVVYKALENASYLTTGNDLFARLALLDSIEEKRMFLDSLIPTINGAAMFAVQRGVAQSCDALFERIKFFVDRPDRYESLFNSMRGQQRNRRLSIDDNPIPWFQQMGDFITQNDTQMASGYKSCAYGFMFGADKRINRDTLVGIGIGGNFATVESGAMQHGKANTFLLIGYGGYTYDDWTVAGNFGYAGSEYLLKRGAVGSRLESKFYGDSFIVGGEASKKVRLLYADLTPFGSLQLITLGVGSYDEALNGGGSVHIAGRESTSLLQTFGLRCGRTVLGPRGTLWNPSLSVGWVHDWGSGDIRSTTTYGGATPFTLIGAIKRRDRGTIGLNLNVTVRRLSIFGSYDGEMAQGYYSNTIQSGFTFAF